MTVRCDDGSQPALDERPPELLDLRAMPGSQRRCVHLHRPASSRELLRDRRIVEHGFRALRVRDHRAKTGRLHVLGECEENVRRPAERHLHQDAVGPPEDVPVRVLIQQRTGRRQLVAKPELEAGTWPHALERVLDLLFALRREREVRPDVWRREEHGRSVLGGAAAECEAVVDRRRPVVPGRDHVRVTVDERTHDPQR